MRVGNYGNRIVQFVLSYRINVGKSQALSNCLILLSGSLFIVLTLIVSGEQSFDQSSKAIKRANDPKRKIGITSSGGLSKKRYIGIWTEDYMQFGQSQGAIVNNIARNSPVQDILQLDDVILAIDGKKVLSSQNLIDSIPLIPPSRDSVVFNILRDEEVLSISCACIYMPPVNPEPFYEEMAPCSLRTVKDGSGNKVIVAPIAYIAYLYNEGGMDAFERTAKELSQKNSIGVYHTLRQGKWFNKGIHDVVIPAAFLRGDLRGEIKNLFPKAFAHFDKTVGKKSCYIIHNSDKTKRLNLDWSFQPIDIRTDTFISNYKFIGEF